VAPRYFRFSARAHITSVLQVCFTPRSGSHVISARSPAQGNEHTCRSTDSESGVSLNADGPKRTSAPPFKHKCPPPKRCLGMLLIETALRASVTAARVGVEGVEGASDRIFALLIKFAQLIR
jgi:hypothetical protein